MLDFLPGYFLSGFDKDVNFTLGLFGESLSSAIKSFEPDVINVHWTWKGFLSFPEICKISKKIPVVWTMHDYSPFSGGMFYPTNGKNIFINFLIFLNSLLRGLFYKYSNIIFVSPSKFLLKEVEKYNRLGDIKTFLINNGIETDIFRKRDKEKVRKKLGLKLEKQYLLFGAINILENKVKGGEFLKKVIQDLEDFLVKENIGLVSFGSQNPFENFQISDSVEKVFFGYVNSETDMAAVLSSADVMLVPSRLENYPFVVMESLSCLTPVVAFNTGGIPEMIKHKENGYLAELNNMESFKDGIKFCLKMSMNNREDFAIQKKATQYIELFNDCLNADR